MPTILSYLIIDYTENMEMSRENGHFSHEKGEKIVNNY